MLPENKVLGWLPSDLPPPTICHQIGKVGTKTKRIEMKRKAVTTTGLEATTT